MAADPAVLLTVQLVIDTADRPSLVSFWQTVLGYEPVGADGLWDPSRRDPGLSFHRSQPRPLRDRIHVDVVRAPDAVEAARAAVGQEPFGAYGVALADADGNEVDVVPGDRLSKGPGTADWQVLFGAMAYYPVDSPARAGEIVSAVAGLADDAGLPLMVDLRPDGVTIDSGKDQWEDGEGSATSRFVDLAGRVQTAARDLGLSADLTRPRFVQLGIDAVDVPAATAADLRGVAGRGSEETPKFAEADAPLPQQRPGGGAASDGDQRWPQDGRGGPATRGDRVAEGRAGRLDAAPR